MFKKLHCFRLTWPRLSLALRVNTLAILVIIFFNESLIYYLQRIQWQVKECGTEKCARILFVADPQLLGEIYERKYARWDSDRHISKNYRQAFSHVRPDAVVFLGDLTDEASVATDAQLRRYFRRFMEIFPKVDGVQVIYLPGDNDIGGEGWEAVSHDKVVKFQEFFGNQTSFKLKNHLNFYIADRIRHEMADEDLSDDFSNATRILIGHYPITHGSDGFSREAIKRFKPHAIFSAHDHKSSQAISRIDSLYPSATFLARSTTFDLMLMHSRSEILEIQVPSCSYRMGALRIGFGQAVFENGSLSYTPLFIVNRFVQLAAYVVLAFLMIITNWALRRNRLKYQNYDRPGLECDTPEIQNRG